MMSQHDSAFAERDRSEPEEGRSHLWTLTGRRLTWITAAASFVLCLALIPSWYLSRPPPGYWLYAAAMDALDDVETVHAHGYGTAFMFERYKLDSAERYELDMWAWVADDGTIRSYDRRGPIVEWDDGERRYEHFGHQDSLYVHKSLYVRKSRLGKSARRPGTHLVMKRRLAELNDSDADFVDLGEHPQNGRLVRIVRKEVPEDKRKEWWFDIESALRAALNDEDEKFRRYVEEALKGISGE